MSNNIYTPSCLAKPSKKPRPKINKIAILDFQPMQLGQKDKKWGFIKKAILLDVFPDEPPSAEMQEEIEAAYLECPKGSITSLSHIGWAPIGARVRLMNEVIYGAV